MKLYIWTGVALIVVGAALYGYKLYNENQKLKVQIVALQNPAKAKVETVVRTITRTIKEPGQREIVEVIKEQTATKEEVKPVIPAPERIFRQWYVSGTYGVNPFRLEDRTWGVGGGLNLSDSLSVGVRVDNRKDDWFAGVEVRVNL